MPTIKPQAPSTAVRVLITQDQERAVFKALIDEVENSADRRSAQAIKNTPAFKKAKKVMNILTGNITLDDI